MERPTDIKDRTFEFALRIVDLSDKLPDTVAGKRIADQLLRSGTSVGANIEEATAASSKDDFAYRVSISLREARETNYWLRILKARTTMMKVDVDDMVQESEELKKILGAIVSKARGKRKS
ncbi:MAG: four helix bundle protein [Bacteroidota bacterium]